VTPQSPSSPVATVTAAQARAHWVRRAGLAEPIGGPLAELVGSTGWLRSLGGVDAHLALLARREGLDSTDVEAAVADRSLAVCPAVRNAIHVVPDGHRPLALAEAHGHWAEVAARQHPAVGITEQELGDLGEAVLAVLDQARSTDEVRRALPEGAVRDLGDAGRKEGISSTLVPALRRLEFTDRVRRRPDGDRLDTERHRWERVAAPAPFTGPAVERRARIASLFAGFAGPFTTGELATWAAVSPSDAEAAIESAGLVAVEVEAVGTAFTTAAQVESMLAGEAVAPDAVRFLGFEDLALVAHSPAAWFDPRHHGLTVPVWGRGEHTIGGASHLFMRTVLVGDRMAGLWAWDPDRQAVEVVMLDAPTGAAGQSVEEARERTTTFLRGRFGHARMTSLDGEATERSRVEALRSLAG